MPPGGSRESSTPLIITAVVLTAGIGGFFWWQKQQKAAVPPPPPPVILPAPRDAAPPPPPVPDAAPAAVSQPLPGVPHGQLPPLDEADGYVAKTLNGLLGRKNVLSFLALDGIIRRFVTTVDNLANEQAPARLWPVKPTPGNFTVEPRDGAPGPANARRYAAFVHFAESVDSRRAVAIYVHLYPLLQQAYEELGFGGKAFHDRVIQVIDHLLATPDLSDPARVRLVEAQGATRPLYQFFDAALESRSAGQKVLLRVGPENAARLKAKLTELRRELTSSPAARKKKHR